MTIKEYLDSIRSSQNYVINSLIINSSHGSGCTYTYLVINSGVANRKEIFIATEDDESDGENRTVLYHIEIVPAN